MESLTHSEVTTFLLAVGVLLGAARLLGEVAQRFRQPAVLGELLAGILLGPTVFGAIAPGLQQGLFPPVGAVPVAIDAIAVLSITLFLLVAGLEVDLSAVSRQGRSALAVGTVGIVLPFAVGFAPAYLFPGFLGAEEGTDTLVFALFLATAMSITALPVIAKILLDLNLFRSDVGIVIIASAIYNDLAGWIIFAFVLALMSGAAGTGAAVGVTIALTLAFAVFMLTVGRWAINRMLPWIQAHSTWPGGVLGFALTAALLCATFTEWIGVHAVFGAFLFGVAIGDSQHLRQRTRGTIDQFISFIFAPLFFASIGLRVDFVNNFDPLLVVIILVLATLGKVFGCTAAARWMGFPWNEAKAIGYGMNARGAMEIILGLLALQAGIIGDRLFVALVVMALATSITSGMLIQRAFGRRKTRNFVDYAYAKTFVPRLRARDREGAIRELGALAAESAGLQADEVFASLWAREQLVSSGIGQGVAVPHARIPGLKQPAIAVGMSREGVDFDAADGEPAKVVVVMLTPAGDASIQLDLLASIARVFLREDALARVTARVRNFTEFRAFVNVETPHA